MTTQPTDTRYQIAAYVEHRDMIESMPRNTEHLGDYADRTFETHDEAEYAAAELTEDRPVGHEDVQYRVEVA